MTFNIVINMDTKVVSTDPYSDNHFMNFSSFEDVIDGKSDKMYFVGNLFIIYIAFK